MKVKILLIDKVLHELSSDSQNRFIYGSIRATNDMVTCILAMVHPLPGLCKVAIWNPERHVMTVVLSAEKVVNLKVKQNKVSCDENEVELITLAYKTDYHSRSKGLFEPERFSGKKAVHLGLGTVGSPIAQGLARAGVTSFALVDKDKVELGNICRTVYIIEDIGDPKPLALQRHLLDINPCAEIETYEKDVLEMAHEELRALLTTASIVICAMDTPAAQLLINSIVFDQVPAIYPAAYQNGVGGEILFTLPGKTTCMNCVLGKVLNEQQQVQLRGEWDYATNGQLKPLAAIYPDVQNITVKATKISLAILLDEQDSPTFTGLLDPRTNLLFVGNTIDWIFQYPYHNIWAKTSIDPECSCQTLQKTSI